MKRLVVISIVLLTAIGAADAFAQRRSIKPPPPPPGRTWLVDVRQGASAATTEKCGLSTPEAPLSGGQVVMACKVNALYHVLEQCEIKGEAVPGLGARADQFMSVTPPPTTLPPNSPVYVNACLEAAPKTPSLATDVNAEWATPVKTPVIPAKAQKAAQHGYAVVRCSIGSSGAVSNCATLTDLPAGFGFADAAIKSLAGAKIKLPASPLASNATMVIPFYFYVTPFVAP